MPGSMPRVGAMSELDVGVPMEVEGKGKGKAKAVPQDLPPIEIGNAISDITNSALCASAKPLGIRN